MIDQVKRSNIATGTQETISEKKPEVQNPFARKPKLAQTPPRARLFSCPELITTESSNTRTDKQSGNIPREQQVLEELGKRIDIIDSIVKEAKNIHKPIRDAISGAVIYYQQLKEMLQSRKPDQPIQEVPKPTVRNAGTQIENPATEEKAKKREASSPLEKTNSDKKTKTKTVIPGTEIISKESAENESEAGGDWIEAKRTKTHKRSQDEQKNKNRRRPPRLPAAVAVKPTNKSASYADILKDLKSKIDPGALGVEVSKVRKARNGDVLIEIAKGGEKVDALRNAVAEVLAENATVRNMQHSTVIELLDLDGTTVGEEVVDAIKLLTPQADRNFIKVLALRRTYGETQKAICSLPAAAADIILKEGKLKIGWSRCRVREKPKITQCYRCFDFGHIAKDCNGPDRTNKCRICSNEGHLAKDCQNQPHCLICSDNKEIGGTNHIVGSRKCGAFRREVDKSKK